MYNEKLLWNTTTGCIIFCNNSCLNGWNYKNGMRTNVHTSHFDRKRLIFVTKTLVFLGYENIIIEYMKIKQKIKTFFINIIIKFV